MFCGVIVVVHLLTKFQICYGKFLMLITENYFSILKGRN
jgi:hypothetical protein